MLTVNRCGLAPFFLWNSDARGNFELLDMNPVREGFGSLGIRQDCPVCDKSKIPAFKSRVYS
jgi:hypothetical protein